MELISKFQNFWKETIYLAIAAAVSFGAGTRVVVESVAAGASVLAGIGLALVNVQFASFAAVAFGAIANELAHAVFTAAAIHAGIRLAFVHVAQAASVEIAAGTIAFESVDQIGTFAYLQKLILILQNKEEKLIKNYLRWSMDCWRIR